jgi:hypothetical protein
MTLGAGVAAWSSATHQPWTSVTIERPTQELCSPGEVQGSATVIVKPQLASVADSLQVVTIAVDATDAQTGHMKASVDVVVPKNTYCQARTDVTQFPNDDKSAGTIVSARFAGYSSDLPTITVMLGKDISGSLTICNLEPRAYTFLQKHQLPANALAYFCPPLSNVTNGADGVRYYETYDVKTLTNALVAGGYVAHNPAVALQVSCSWNEPADSAYSCRDLVASIFKLNTHRQ